MSPVIKVSAVHYPESDGKPMGETDEHRDAMVRHIELLRRRFAGQQVYVSGDLLVYYEQGNPKKYVVPDAFVAKGVSPEKRRIYKIWIEGKAPDAALETTSRKTKRQDTVTKPALYARLGIKEYFLFDPMQEYLDPPLQGHRLIDPGTPAAASSRGAAGGAADAPQYEKIEPKADGSLVSQELGLRLRFEQGKLACYRLDTGERVRTDAEQAAFEAEARRAAEIEAARLREELRVAAQRHRSWYLPPAALRVHRQAGYQRRGRFGDYPDHPLSVFMEKRLERGADMPAGASALAGDPRSQAAVPTLRWLGDVNGHLRLIDQTLLPVEFKEIDCRTVEQVWEAIRQLRVRGAPAIGIAAAYGVCLGMQTAANRDEAAFFARLDEVASYLATSRPTAVNLFWAIERMKRAAHALRGRMAPSEIVARLLAEAHAICEEDRQMCRAIGRHGAALLADGQGVLTHCNAGGLATADYGTALAAIFAAHEQGKRLHVYADETRPLLQGARLTAWELAQRGIEVTLICDSMAAQVMREGRVQAVIVGADRIAANGDTANKIGTYQVALAAAAHSIPLYVAAPSSTFDLSLASGDAIPIEERPAEEITHGFGRQTAPSSIHVYNPAFDVTPARLIEAIICEHGVIRPVTAEQIASTLGNR